MSATKERAPMPHTPNTERSPMSLTDIVNSIPEAINFAKIEAESMNIAHTPEGKFVLTYLLASRNILNPVLADLTAVPEEFLTQIGGLEYNPERTIDAVGALVASRMFNESNALPPAVLRTEESGEWVNPRGQMTTLEEAQRYILIDPLDETSAIPKGNRFQTTAIGIFNRDGSLRSIGIISLVDDGFMFFERNGEPSVHAHPEMQKKQSDDEQSRPIRVATLTRRMYPLRSRPLFSSGEGEWSIDSIGGYTVLAMNKGEIDSIIDPLKGNPWHEFALWGPAAEALGFTVTDPDGKPIDTPKILRHAIEHNPPSAYRIPFVMSRTPEINEKVVNLLKIKR